MATISEAIGVLANAANELCDAMATVAHVEYEPLDPDTCAELQWLLKGIELTDNATTGLNASDVVKGMRAAVEQYEERNDN